MVKATHKPPGYTPPLHQPNNNWARGDEERAETYVEHLEQKFQPNDMTTDVSSDIILTEEDGADLFSPKGIKNMISKKLNPKKHQAMTK